MQPNNEVDEPSNIKWENLDVTTGEKCRRLTCVYLLVLAFMLITFAIIIIANIVKPVNNENCP